MHTLGNSYHLMFSRGADGRVKRDEGATLCTFWINVSKCHKWKETKSPSLFLSYKKWRSPNTWGERQTQWDVLCRGECDERAVCDAGSDLLLVSGVPAEVSSQHFFPFSLTEEVKCVCWWYYAHCQFTKFSFWILFCLLLNEGVWNASLHASSGT